MRARLHESWPALSYHFGLLPNVAPYELSTAELERYVDALVEMNREAEAARRASRRRR